MHVFEMDRASGHRDRTGVRPVDDCRLNIERLEDAVGGGQALLQLGVQDGHLLDRIVGQHDRGDEGDERSFRLGTADHLVGAIEHHGKDRQTAQKIDDRMGDRLGPEASEIEAKQTLDCILCALGLALFHGVGLDVARAAKGLVEEGRETTDFGLPFARYPPHAPADQVDGYSGKRQKNESGQGQPPILINHHGNQEGRGEEMQAEAGQSVRHRIAQPRDIVDQPGDQRAVEWL